MSDFISPIDIAKYAWGRRALQANAPFIQNPDGSRSTHLMATGERNGINYAYPTVVQSNTGLTKMNPREALNYNLLLGEAVPFGSNAALANEFAQGAYKVGTPLEDKSIGSLLSKLLK